MTTDIHRLTLSPKIAVELAIIDGYYEGIHTALLDETPFLVAGRGSKPYFTTPDGIVYTRFRVRDISAEASGRATLDLEAIGTCLPVQENRDMFLFPRVSTHSGSVSDTLTVVFTPRTVDVDGESYEGFSLGYEFRSDEGRQIHWMMENVALAPGGTIAGTHIAAQHMTTTNSPLETTLEPASPFQTEESYGMTCIQAPCRGGGSDLFDLASGPVLAVSTYFERPAALKATREKTPGEDFLTSTDFHYAALSAEFRTEPRLIVAAKISPNAATREADLNRWTAWRDFTGRLWQEALGIPPPTARRALALDGTGAGGIDPGYTRATLLTDWAARLDWVQAQGFDAVILHTPEWLSAANQKTLVFGGNNCTPFEFTLSDHLGGNAGLKTFCDAAHAHGVKVFVWIGGHLSREAPIFKEHPDWATRTLGNLLFDGHYGGIHAFSFPAGGREWMADALRRVREATGIDGVWFDSFTNLCMQAVNYQSPTREPNMPSVLAFLGDLSGMGYELMMECTSQLGLSSWGNWEPSAIQGHEEMLYGTGLRTYLTTWLSNPVYTEDYYFRSLAANGPLGMWLEEFEGKPAPFPLPIPAWYAPLNAAYAQVCAGMQTRTLLPDGAGALWRDAEGHPRALFAFRDGDWQTPAACTDLTTGQSWPASESVPTVSGHIYRLSGG